MKDFFEDLGKRLSETAEAVTAKAETRLRYRN